jgi:Mrp family chromosome partitioning ATPase
VIIDTPAVAQFADGLAVANLAKGVLLLSRSNSTSFKEMRELLRRLASTKSEVLGAVINDF